MILTFAAVGASLLLLIVVHYLRTYFRKGLRDLPGPIFARLSYLYRLSMVYNGDGSAQYRKIHEKYGPIVRVGPNEVSIADPTMIPVIYGIGSKLTKVRLELYSLYSTKEGMLRF